METLDEKRKRLAALLAQQHSEVIDYKPLSVGQRSVWYLDRLFPNNPAYNIAVITRFEFGNSELLDKAFRHLVNRHPMLRTLFPVKNGLPVQVTLPFWNFKLNICDLADLGDLELEQQAWDLAGARFDLQKVYWSDGRCENEVCV